MQQNGPIRNFHGSLPEALAAVRGQLPVSAAVRFPGEDAGHSLNEMAQRDLDAALQLLADRAQYITGATGAAIALRRDGSKDMLCRASTGSNAPELGALLSTEFGLSGESVRTKRALRCDDAERDSRVNREVCRRLGIASVVVMPVVNDDGVLGVFELFSGQANAFGDRDLSAIRRLSEMVETAVRMAQAVERLPEQLNVDLAPVPVSAEPVVGTIAESVVDIEIEQSTLDVGETVSKPIVPTQEIASAIPTEPVVVEAPQALESAAAELPKPAEAKTVSEPTVQAKPLFWSAAAGMGADAGKPVESDQSHVPPVLRSLRKCEACGFPVSASRTLCVECEEKKWKGHLKRPQ